MPTAAPIPDLFSEFVTAGSGPAAQPRDVLDHIGEWLAFNVERIAGIRKELARLTTEGKRRFGERFSDYEFTRQCDPDEMAKSCWGIAVRIVETDYIAPQHVEVSNVGSFLLEAFGKNEEPRDEKMDEHLKSWDAERIRVHFRRTFGDVREAAIGQLRTKALDAFGRQRPEDVSTIWLQLHESAHRGGFMRLTYRSRHHDRFGDLVRYLMHLAIGEAPSEILVPPVFGYNDGAREWERKELLKRQKAPFPGCEWLRFTADGYLQIKLDAVVLARLQNQFDAKKLGGDER